MTVELKAPIGKFRVVGVDTFSNEDFVAGDYKTLPEALKEAEGLGGTMMKVHVYDATGKHLAEFGTF